MRALTFRGEIGRLRKAIYISTGSELAAMSGQGYSNTFADGKTVRVKLWGNSVKITKSLKKAIAAEFGAEAIVQQVSHWHSPTSIVVHYKKEV